MSTLGHELVQAAIIAALFVLATAAIGFGLVALRRRLPLLGQARRLQLVERIDLGDRRFVAVVRIDRRELLVSGGTQGVQLLEPLGELEPPVEPASIATPVLVEEISA